MRNDDNRKLPPLRGADLLAVDVARHDAAPADVHVQVPVRVRPDVLAGRVEHRAVAEVDDNNSELTGLHSF